MGGLFNIEVVSKKAEEIDGLMSYWGCIKIESYSERFVMPVQNWDLQDYLRQWKEGLDRITYHDFSCLVTSVQNLDTNPLIEMWSLYKDKDHIVFQNSLLIDETIEHTTLKLADFNRRTCYQFIDYPRETVTEDGYKISEWVIGRNDFFFCADKILKKLSKDTVINR